MTPRNVLIVGSTHEGAIEHAYGRALRRAGASVTQFDLLAPSRHLRFNRAADRLTQRAQTRLASGALRRYLSRAARSYDLVIVFKGLHLTPEALRACRELTDDAHWVNVNPDDPLATDRPGTANANVTAAIPLFDCYVTWTPRLQPGIRAAGSDRVAVLPFAGDADVHFRPDHVDESLSGTFVFAGTWDPERARLLEAMADFPLRIAGHGWDRVAARSPLRDRIHPHNVYGAALRRLIGSAAGAFNFLRPQNRGSHNMRTFEIPSMGGLMLTMHTEEQDTFFPDGEGCFMYRDLDDLRATLRAVLADPSTADQVRRQGLQLSARHTYDARARSLLSLLDAHR
jgi:hypothetical protein